MMAFLARRRIGRALRAHPTGATLQDLRAESRIDERALLLELTILSDRGRIATSTDDSGRRIYRAVDVQ